MQSAHKGKSSTLADNDRHWNYPVASSRSPVAGGGGGGEGGEDVVVIPCDSGLSRSDTFHSARSSIRSFDITTEKGGRKLMSEEEVSDLVHNALMRARQATVGMISTDDRPTRPASLSPQRKAFAPSPTKHSLERRPFSFDEHHDESWSQRHHQQQSTTNRYVSVEEYSDDSGHPTSTSLGPPPADNSTAASSDMIIRRVEEEIANARRAAYEANLRLAGVMENMEMTEAPTTTTPNRIKRFIVPSPRFRDERQRETGSDSFTLPSASSFQFRNPQKRLDPPGQQQQQQQQLSHFPSKNTVRFEFQGEKNDVVELLDDRDEESVGDNSIPMLKNIISLESASMEQLSPREAVMTTTNESFASKWAEAQFDELLTGATNDEDEEADDDEDNAVPPSPPRNERNQMEGLLSQLAFGIPGGPKSMSQSFGHESATPSFDVSVENAGQHTRSRLFMDSDDEGMEELSAEEGPEPPPTLSREGRTTTSFRPQLSAEGNVIMRFLANNDSRRKKEQHDEPHPVIDLTHVVESYGASGDVNEDGHEFPSYHPGTESFNEEPLKYDAPMVLDPPTDCDPNTDDYGSSSVVNSGSTGQVEVLDAELDDHFSVPSSAVSADDDFIEPSTSTINAPVYDITGDSLEAKTESWIEPGLDDLLQPDSDNLVDHFCSVVKNDTKDLTEPGSDTVPETESEECLPTDPEDQHEMIGTQSSLAPGEVVDLDETALEENQEAAAEGSECETEEDVLPPTAASDFVETSPHGLLETAGEDSVDAGDAKDLDHVCEEEEEGFVDCMTEDSADINNEESHRHNAHESVLDAPISAADSQEPRSVFESIEIQYESASEVEGASSKETADDQEDNEETDQISNVDGDLGNKDVAFKEIPAVDQSCSKASQAASNDGKNENERSEDDVEGPAITVSAMSSDSEPTENEQSTSPVKAELGLVVENSDGGTTLAFLDEPKPAQAETEDDAITAVVANGKPGPPTPNGEGDDIDEVDSKTETDINNHASPSEVDTTTNMTESKEKKVAPASPRKVRFKQRYPVPPFPKKPRASEDVIKDCEVPHTASIPFLSKPKPDLRQLLTAAVGPSMQRRSNACGALKVLATQKKNKLTLVRTAGCLDALVFAATVDIPAKDTESAMDARTRAIAAISNLSEAKDNREIVYCHPGLISALIKAMVDDKGEARMVASGALVLLSKTVSNREPMARTPGMINALVMLVTRSRHEPEYSETPTNTFSSDYVSDQDSSYSTNSESTSSSADDYSSGDSQDDYSEHKVASPLSRAKSMRQQMSERREKTIRMSQMNACAVLLQLSKQCGAAAAMGQSDVLLRALVKVSRQQEDEPMHTKCLEILCNISRFPANNEWMATFPGLVDMLVLNGNSTEWLDRVWSLRVLQNLSSHVSGKTVLANKVVLELLSFSVMRDTQDEQLAAIATLHNLSTEPGAVVPLTNCKNVVATLVHVAHNVESMPDARDMACDALATLGLWLQTLAGAGTLPNDIDQNTTLPSYVTSGWNRWD